MKTKQMNETTLTKAKVMKFCGHVLFALAIVGIFALATIEPSIASNLWDSGAAAQSVGNAFSNLYTQWFWPLFIANAIVLAVSKNDKVKGVAKSTLIGISVVYVICLISSDGSYVKNTLQKIANFLKG